jgi:hypothetical protein
LTAAAYFDRETKDERELRTLAQSLYDRADWHWAQNKGLTVTHGWKAEDGDYQVSLDRLQRSVDSLRPRPCLADVPASRESYREWTRTYQWKKIYGHEFLYSGPIFIHHLSHMWIDFRGIQDEYMRAKALNYFETAGAPVYVQQEYAMRNPEEV